MFVNVRFCDECFANDLDFSVDSVIESYFIFSDKPSEHAVSSVLAHSVHRVSEIKLFLLLLRLHSHNPQVMHLSQPTNVSEELPYGSSFTLHFRNLVKILNVEKT